MLNTKYKYQGCRNTRAAMRQLRDIIRGQLYLPYISLTQSPHHYMTIYGRAQGVKVAEINRLVRIKIFDNVHDLVNRGIPWGI